MYWVHVFKVIVTFPIGSKFQTTKKFPTLLVLQHDSPKVKLPKYGFSFYGSQMVWFVTKQLCSQLLFKYGTLEIQVDNT